MRGKAKEKRAKIIVAIDFGTTFSGIAYANTDAPEVQTVLKSWGRGTPSDDKVPTIIRYDNGGTTGPFKWGFQARKQLQAGEKVHEWFKLGLCPEYEARRAAESELIRRYPSTTALEPVKGEDAEKLVVDYLWSLKKCVDEHLGALGMFVKAQTRDYIITVPAIWDHKEQERTRNCAERAGIGKGSSLRIIAEPEAAAIYALEKMRTRLDLGVNDTIVICDAGGGTVDLTSYTIRSLDPISLVGAGKGSGGLCGSSFLNRILIKYLQRKLRDYMGGWDQKCLNHVVNEFERTIKSEFTGDDDETHMVMVRGLSDSPLHGIRGENLHLTSKELRENVYDEVIQKIQGLVRDQIMNTNGRVKAVLLAGGFGQSSYLKQQLEQLKIVQERKIRVAVIDESNTAIVRGALLAGLSRHGRDQGGVFKVKTRVESRIAPRSYGTRAYQLFQVNDDDPGRRIEQPTGENLVERMFWLAAEGDSIQDGEPKSFSFEKEQQVSMGRITEVEIDIYSCEERDTGGIKKPKYHDDRGVRHCANFVMDLRKFDVPVETRNGIEMYVANIDIEMTLDSASLSFRGVYKGSSGETRFEPKFVQFV